MSKNIYSDIRAELLETEIGSKRLYIYDGTGINHPTLVLPNLLAIKNLRDYLNEIIEDNPKYFENL